MQAMCPARLPTQMRAADWINAVYFLFLLVVTWVRPLPHGRRIRVTALTAVGIGMLGLGLLFARVARPSAGSVIRDWLPAPMILVAYWQAGQFFTQASERVQCVLIRFDENLFQFFRRRFGSGFRWSSAYFEFSYLFCYPMVPLGVSALYLMHLQDHTDQFWVVVLPATYACYLVLPFLQVLPPWMLGGHTPEARGAFRRLNLLINRHLSIRVDTFPSAHVAASLGVALALLRLSPLVGLLFLWLAINIAIGSVVRRYHYTLDVLLGAALALLALLVSLFFEA
jgi:hypothetical protein